MFCCADMLIDIQACLDFVSLVGNFLFCRRRSFVQIVDYRAYLVWTLSIQPLQLEWSMMSISPRIKQCPSNPCTSTCGWSSTIGVNAYTFLIWYLHQHMIEYSRNPLPKELRVICMVGCICKKKFRFNGECITWTCNAFRAGSMIGKMNKWSIFLRSTCGTNPNLYTR